jgi:ribosomal protein S27E
VRTVHGGGGPRGFVRYATCLFVFRGIFHAPNLVRAAEILRIHGALTPPGGNMAEKKKDEQAAAPAGGLADGVLVQVCVECGNEYFFDNQQTTEDLTCERCGNTVFRSFFDVTDGDEAAADFRETTDRDITPEDPGTEVSRGDLYDLNNP